MNRPSKRHANFRGPRRTDRKGHGRIAACQGGEQPGYNERCHRGLGRITRGILLGKKVGPISHLEWLVGGRNPWRSMVA